MSIMLEIQALKFARTFKKSVELILTEEWTRKWLSDLYDSHEKAKKDGKSTEYFLQAEEEFVRGRHEGRIIVRKDDGSGSSAG